MKYPALILGAAIALIAADPTPPPPPPVLASPSLSPTPAPSPSPSGSPAVTIQSLLGQTPKPSAAPKGGGPKETPSPIPDERKGLDGVWEVEIQRGDVVEYEHFNIKQTGTTLTGVYLTHDKKKYPVAGSLDGQSVRLVVTLADGSTILLEARVDGTTDMLGMFTDAKERVPFTAAYRPKEKWIDNLNAQPGGLGGAPGGGGGPGPPK